MVTNLVTIENSPVGLRKVTIRWLVKLLFYAVLTWMVKHVQELHYKVPLQFLFNRNAGLSLPLIALQYHEVRIDVEFRELNEVFINTGNPNDVGFTEYQAHLELLVCTLTIFIWILMNVADLLQVSHEYLIEQFSSLVKNQFANKLIVLSCYFNHPVKELI